jgi:WD40 repeat protein
MFARRIMLAIALVLLITASLGLPAPQATTAQDEPTVRVIPVKGEYFGAVLSPDGHWLLTYEYSEPHDDEILLDYLPLRLIDLDTGEEGWLTGHTDYVYHAAFSPDSQRIASYHGNGDLLIWDVASRTISQRLLAVPEGGRVAFLADGQHLATLLSSNFTLIAIWDLATGHVTQMLAPRYSTLGRFRHETNIFSQRVLSFVSSPDSSALWAITWYTNLEQWDLTTGQVTRLRSSDYTMPRMAARGMELLADGHTLAFFDREEGVLTFFDTATGEDVRTLPIPTELDVVVAPDGTRVAWLDATGGLSLVVQAVDGSGEPPVIPLPDDYGELHNQVDRNLKISSDGRRVVVSGFTTIETGDNAVIVVDLPE